jgi:hypothetical protein
LSLTRSLWTAASSSRSATTEKIFLLFLIVGIVAFADDGSVGIDLVVIIRVFGAIPQAVAVILVDGPAAVLVFVVIVGTLAATEATEIIRVVVVRKSQWLH